jgi:transketolase
LNGRFALNRVEIVREGADLLIVVMGAVAAEAVAAAEIMADHGIACAVAVIATLNPAPIDDLIALLGQYPLALTAEAHYVVGGIGSLASEVIAENGLHCRIVRCGVRETPSGITGSTPYLYARHGLSGEGLAEKAMQVFLASECA